ncbi:MAG TPA: carboxymuconolactone decarboxylase family protein [Candidatus Baltobacteraceae bacterium]|nr:carboxymuconolactone decarboxylase family protein [Candidatus Baltobacteraceae bacterium]
MSEKLDMQSVAPEVFRPLFESNKLLAASGLEQRLLTLVEIRASQINGCAFCLALHRREGEAAGESSDRLFGVAAWHDAPWYSERERAALEWTEAITQIAKERPAGDLLDRMKQHFTEREIVYLTVAVNVINSYNRFNVAFGTSPDRAEGVFNMLHSATRATA